MLNGIRGLYQRANLLPLLIPTKLRREIGWVVFPFGSTQVLRLITSIVLTRLLAPEVFGLMLLINTLRTGVELLSDIGIGQSVVRSPHGEDNRFLNVAWTLQLMRGILLAAVALIVAQPVAQVYDRPELTWLIMSISPVFILTGLQSPGLFLAQRRIELPRRAIFDIATTFFNSAFAIGLAIIIPSVWALVIGLVLGTLSQTVLTYLAFDRRLPRLVWDKRHAHEIFGFGKWIFLSTAIFFAAISFDRLYFVAVLPIAFAGIYSVARTFSDMVAGLAQRAGAYLVFPRIAAMQNRHEEMALRLRATRFKTLALVAIITGLAIAGSDQFILLAYDERYHAAAFMIPILLLSVWFGVLSSFADSMLMGRSRPAPGAAANGAKFLTLLIGLPLAIAQGSVLTALGVLVLGEVARWAALSPASRGERFASPIDDLKLTLLMAVTAVITKVIAGKLGIVPTIGEWWSLYELLRN